MKMSIFWAVGHASILMLACPSSQAITLKGTMPAGYALVAVTPEGESTTGKGTFTLEPSGGKARLYAIDDKGSLAGPVILAVKRGGQFYTYQQAKKGGKSRVCSSSKASFVLGTSASTSKGKLNLGTIKVDEANGIAYLTKRLNKQYLDKAGSSLASIADGEQCLPGGTGNTLGLKTAIAAAKPFLSAEALPEPADASTSPGGDKDKDGLVDALDIDKDDDGILNPYDPDSAGGPEDNSFRIFSNLKLDIESSLNQYVKNLTSVDLNNAIANVGLAIQVAGAETDSVELNCFGLSYCSSGGTGTTAEGNKAFPDEFDSDGDGFGKIERGSTNDFQLRPNVHSTSAIKGGDTYVEVVTDGSGKVTEIPGMLSFVFSTTPAIASVTMGDVVTPVTYPPTIGTMNNPFLAPADWNGVLTLSAYRPQRVGLKAAGEGDFVDIGGSLITIDIPNAPCTDTPGSGCVSASGPGNCRADAYTSTSSELIADPNGLKDSRGDQNTDTANPSANLVSFSIDLNNCLGSHILDFRTNPLRGPAIPQSGRRQCRAKIAYP